MAAFQSMPSLVFMAPDTSGPGEPGADPVPNIEEARRRIAKVLDNGLDALDIGRLHLREIPEEVFALTNLKQLNLGGNRLIALNPRLFAALTKLEFLDLTANDLTTMP